MRKESKVILITPYLCSHLKPVVYLISIRLFLFNLTSFVKLFVFQFKVLYICTDNNN